MKNQSVKNSLEAAFLAVCILALGALDFLTGRDMSFFAFYFIPTAIVASRHGAKAAYALALLCAAVWFTSDLLTGPGGTPSWKLYWNSLMRFAAFVFVGHLVARIRTLWIASQKEVKTLRGLLPICAKCKKIRDVSGNWHHIESYISDRTEVQFSHGLCKHCAAQALRELSNEVAAEY